LAIVPNLMMLTPMLLGAREMGFGGSRRVPIAYAQFFQNFWLQFMIFFSCVSVFSQLFRSEFLEKTLHHYYLVPIRREAVVLGKFLTAFLSMVLLFSTTTASTYLLFFWPAADGREWKYPGDENAWPMIREPMILPFRLMGMPPSDATGFSGKVKNEVLPAAYWSAKALLGRRNITAVRALPWEISLDANWAPSIFAK